VKPSFKLFALAAAVLAVGIVGYRVGYASPRDTLLRQIDQARRDNASYEAWIQRRAEVSKGLERFAGTTLGASGDEVEARFRSGLNAIAASCGLTGISVNSTKPDAVENPGGKAKALREPSSLRSLLAKQADFSVIKGDLTGSGSLSQVFRAIALVQAQPWAHRIESFSIRPEGKEREQFVLRLAVATLILPREQAPRVEQQDVSLVSLADGAEAAWRRIVAKNVFKEPPPAPAQPVVASAPLPPPSAPQRPAFEDWKLTGVVQSRLGIEAFLVNVKTNQRLSLPTGAAVADAKFLRGEGERAVFEIAGEQFEISNGQTLEQRRPVTR
jgi:hypothetical protein